MLNEQAWFSAQMMFSREDHPRKHHKIIFPFGEYSHDQLSTSGEQKLFWLNVVRTLGEHDQQVLLPKLGQMFLIGRQVIIQHASGSLHIINDRVQQQTLVCFLAAAFHCGVNTDLGD